jgi:hypothetical protein
MTSASSSQVLAATRQWLKPLIHVLIRCGVTWKDFATLARTTYVEVATRQFGKRGRPTNVSRTAVLTGLARREVRTQRERLATAPEAWSAYVSKASLVLASWHLDPEFLGPDGKPRQLPINGDGVTFTSLVRHCGASDVRPSTLLKELRAAGAVRVTAEGNLEALQRAYIPHNMDEQMIRLWATAVADLSTTLVHNLTRAQSTPPRFERNAANIRVRAAALGEFRQFVNREGQIFLERVDDWLAQHEVPAAEQETTQHLRLGIGVYHIQDPGPETVAPSGASTSPRSGSLIPRRV